MTEQPEATSGKGIPEAEPVELSVEEQAARLNGLLGESLVAMVVGWRPANSGSFQESLADPEAHPVMTERITKLYQLIGPPFESILAVEDQHSGQSEDTKRLRRILRGAVLGVRGARSPINPNLSGDPERAVTMLWDNLESQGFSNLVSAALQTDS